MVHVGIYTVYSPYAAALGSSVGHVVLIEWTAKCLQVNKSHSCLKTSCYRCTAISCGHPNAWRIPICMHSVWTIFIYAHMHMEVGSAECKHFIICMPESSKFARHDDNSKLNFLRCLRLSAVSRSCCCRWCCLRSRSGWILIFSTTAWPRDAVTITTRTCYSFRIFSVDMCSSEPHYGPLIKAYICGMDARLMLFTVFDHLKSARTRAINFDDRQCIWQFDLPIRILSPTVCCCSLFSARFAS